MKYLKHIFESSMNYDDLSNLISVLTGSSKVIKNTISNNLKNNELDFFKLQDVKLWDDLTKCGDFKGNRFDSYSGINLDNNIYSKGYLHINLTIYNSDPEEKMSIVDEDFHEKVNSFLDEIESKGFEFGSRSRDFIKSNKTRHIDVYYKVSKIIDMNDKVFKKINK